MTDPEDDPFRRRLLLVISILIVIFALVLMEWWATFGIECTNTDPICECAPRGPRCWLERHPL